MGKKRNMIIPYLLILLVFAAACIARVRIEQMNSFIEENGKISMSAVLEQVQQVYELQVGSFYSRLRVIDDYVAQGNTGILDNEEIRNFLACWQKETGARLFFLRENGEAMTIDKEEHRLDISTTLLLGLKKNQNIAKLIPYDDGTGERSCFLMAIPCREYEIDGETYTAVGALVDRSDIDSLFKLYVYGGEASLFILDEDGEVVYTNQQDEKLFRNYSLLKHLEKDDALNAEEMELLQSEFKEQNRGIEVLDGDLGYYLGYSPLDNNNNNNMFVSIVPKSAVDNTLTEYHKLILYTTSLMAIIICLMFVGLVYSTTKMYLTNQKLMYEKQKRDWQRRELRETQEKLAQSRLQNAGSQMQPHFLYNALASIREIILEDPEYASDLVCDFTTHLRACVRSMSSGALVPFNQELENIRAYVNIEKMRFGDKLKILYDCPVTDFDIIQLSIQPLVENAIRHGIFQRGMSGGTVTVRTRRNRENIVIEVEDNGVGFDYDAVTREIQNGTRDSSGITNLKFRFKKMMDADVMIESAVENGTKVTVTIPVPDEGGDSDEGNISR